mgnify:CR=1 FL=1
MYRPMQDANALVLDAVNIDLMTMHKADNDILQQMVLDFVSAYGFLGFYDSTADNGTVCYI